jgi:AcrR family transcriptional regulator
MDKMRPRRVQLAEAGSPPRGKKEKLTRAQKTEQIKSALFQAAASVVGEHGYLNAMIQMITSKANVANGTFYNYFETRQDLFDQLLPALGREMLTFIGDRSQEGSDEIERERKRLLAFFDFLQARPEFYRILYEAEVFAPAAFEEHTSVVKKRYVAVLERALKAGEITGYSSRELEVVVMILMGARQYMAMTYGPQNGRSGKLPPWVSDAYVKFIAGGLRALAEPDAEKSRAASDPGR